jgi:succinate dehydrogenase/fumarate reductase flavoprotein subunit
MNLEIVEKHISTDILVVGGGIAGFFAAIKAREKGLDVVLTDKAYAGKTGATDFAEGDIVYFRPQRGHSLEAWIKQISLRCEYINNWEWDEILLKESEDRYNDLVSWGVKFYEENGQLFISKMGVGDGDIASRYEYISMMARQYTATLRKKTLESGVKILDRVMICELLKQEGAVVGAIGFHTTTGNLYIIKAKATVMATGIGSSSNKTGATNVHNVTGDGDAMAYRAGAKITGKEFTVAHMLVNPGALLKMVRESRKGAGISGKIIDAQERFPFVTIQTGWLGPSLNSEGNPVLFPLWDVHCGRAPLYWDAGSNPPEFMDYVRRFFQRTGTAEVDKIGLNLFEEGKVQLPASRTFGEIISVITGSGIWPVDKSCASGVPGLYSAGNNCATLGSGATYAGMGFGLNHGMVTGARAGLGAAEYSMKFTPNTLLDEAEVARAKKLVVAPVMRTGGFSPAWLTQVLQGTVVPYYALQVKHKDRMEAVLTLIEFLQTHLVPKLIARDAHEWRMAQETRNMILNVEMQLRSSLFRTESRGGHFREDYPKRDDPAWLAWVLLKEEQGKMIVFKEMVPEKWWPDLSEPLEKRYPGSFLGE